MLKNKNNNESYLHKNFELRVWLQAYFALFQITEKVSFGWRVGCVFDILMYVTGSS